MLFTLAIIVVVALVHEEDGDTVSREFAPGNFTEIPAAPEMVTDRVVLYDPAAGVDIRWSTRNEGSVLRVYDEAAGREREYWVPVGTSVDGLLGCRPGEACAHTHVFSISRHGLFTGVLVFDEETWKAQRIPWEEFARNKATHMEPSNGDGVFIVFHEGSPRPWATHLNLNDLTLTSQR